MRLSIEHGSAVFSNRALPSGALSRLLELSRSVLGPKYSGEALCEALQAEIGDKRLADAHTLGALARKTLLEVETYRLDAFLP